MDKLNPDFVSEDAVVNLFLKKKKKIYKRAIEGDSCEVVFQWSFGDSTKNKNFFVRIIKKLFSCLI